MYGKTVDEFEYQGVKFRWVLSPNGYIYMVYHGSGLIGGVPVSQVRNRYSPEAIKALYPICDAWLEKMPGGLAVEVAEEQPPVVIGEIIADVVNIGGWTITDYIEEITSD